jgi:hypothetical protein
MYASYDKTNKGFFYKIIVNADVLFLKEDSDILK